MIKELIFVGIGSAFGGVLRYLVSVWMARASLGASSFPIATFSVNILGCFLLGFLGGYMAKLGASSQLVLLATVGFCGGFTTFSTFSKESLALFSNGFFAIGIFYIFASVILGLIAVAAGFFISNLN